MRPDARGAWSLLTTVASAWQTDRLPSMGAALAYYTMFSLAPLLLIVVSVAGLVFGPDAARGEIELQLRSLMGDQAASAIQGLLASADKPAQGRIATAAGLALLFIGATTVFAELQDALDLIWRVPQRRERSGWWLLLRSRLLSFGMILAIGFLLVVSLLASTALALVGRWWSPAFGAWYELAAAIDLVAGFGLVAALFALIYKVMPRARVHWKDVWVGALVTAALFTLGRSLIGLYVGQSGVATAFGAAGSLVVLLLWVYWSAQIFLIGAEFTWVYANRYGSRSGDFIKSPLRSAGPEHAARLPSA